MYVNMELKNKLSFLCVHGYNFVSGWIEKSGSETINVAWHAEHNIPHEYLHFLCTHNKTKICYVHLILCIFVAGLAEEKKMWTPIYSVVGRVCILVKTVNWVQSKNGQKFLFWLTCSKQVYLGPFFFSCSRDKITHIVEVHDECSSWHERNRKTTKHLFNNLFVRNCYHWKVKKEKI